MSYDLRYSHLDLNGLSQGLANGHNAGTNGLYDPTNGHLDGLNGVTQGLNSDGLLQGLLVDSHMDVKDFWRKFDIQVLGKDAPLPILSMNAFKWPHKIAEALAEDKFTNPTPIQCQSWPIALAGRDLVGVAQTGSGKTLCYVLPAFAKILKDKPQRQPKCLILAPTRELAQQIQSVVRRYRFANNVCLYGGAARGPQLRQIREMSPQIIIATPGRLNDFLESRQIDLHYVDYLVLDEADRMLDMGFEPQLKKIIAMLPAERQTLMWSATWPKEVRQLAAQYMKDYIQINVGGVELTANKNIKQHIEICEEFDKRQKLFDLLTKVRADSKDNKTIIFAETKRKVNDLANELRANGWPAASIHGDKPQQERDWVLKDFRTGRSPILVATDVAARGLDVDDIKYVINFDYPNGGEDYVHRIGRTGRRDRKGTAFTFFTLANAKQAQELIDVLKEAEQTVEPKLFDLAQQSRYMSGGKRRRYGNAGGGGGGWGGNRGSGGGFGGKRKYEGGSSGGPPSKRPSGREYELRDSSRPTRWGAQNSGFSSSNNYSSSTAKSSSSYGSSSGAATQNRYNSY